MRTHTWTLLALALVSRGALAQNEAALRAAFEGKSLTLKVDMPATSQGIDVFPQESMPVNWREMAERMKEHGTALKPGQQVMITKVVVKKDSHIEFQLGGGGYGTFGDYMGSSSSVSAVEESESREERELREQIKQAPGPTRRKQLEKELANKRGERERENSRARAEAAQANEAREANLRVKRAESGSRFNLRYKQGIPPFALTPEGVAAALAPYADIAGMPVVAAGETSGAGARNAASPPGNALASTAPPSASSSAASGTSGGLAGMKKGLSVREVETLLGPAATANEVQEGTLTVMKRTYTMEGKKVSASFVGGVLIDFVITPQ
ncbi:MAG: hypothetical protein IPF98_01260 [Gemmatimonadetes bacterium]|nr:hypothetical protein [Gemmatimonadota bacterium]MCC6772427.1 hypothetical protein [Gemmatimonadaceae bacterium]